MPHEIKESRSRRRVVVSMDEVTYQKIKAIVDAVDNGNNSHALSFSGICCTLLQCAIEEITDKPEETK